jgi:Ankyrin repeats (3 copies)/zinc-ribbon domain
VGSAEVKLNCPHCGAANRVSPADPLCHHCGERLDEALPPPPTIRLPPAPAFPDTVKLPPRAPGKARPRRASSAHPQGEAVTPQGSGFNDAAKALKAAIAIGYVLFMLAKFLMPEGHQGSSGGWQGPGVVPPGPRSWTTPLHGAAARGDAALVKQLTSRAGAVNLRDSEGRTPLHLAAMEHQLQVAKVLIARGAQINARDSRRHTPLHYATQANDAQMKRLLLGHGAVP